MVDSRNPPPGLKPLKKENSCHFDLQPNQPLLTMDAALSRGVTSPALRRFQLGERKSSFGKSPRGNLSKINKPTSSNNVGDEEIKDPDSPPKVTYLSKINSDFE